MARIRAAIVGAGDCDSALAQGNAFGAVGARHPPSACGRDGRDESRGGGDVLAALDLRAASSAAPCGV